MNKALTWDELANIYDKHNSKKARIQPMDKIFEWAKNKKEIFYFNGITVVHAYE